MLIGLGLISLALAIVLVAPSRGPVVRLDNAVGSFPTTSIWWMLMYHTTRRISLVQPMGA